MPETNRTVAETDFTDCMTTVRILDELVGRFGFTNDQFRQLYHAYAYAPAIAALRSYCINRRPQFRAGGTNEMTARRLASCLDWLRTGRQWSEAIAEALRQFPRPVSAGAAAPAARQPPPPAMAAPPRDSVKGLHAEVGISGGDWTDAEIEAVVASYFTMLDDELEGRPVDKAAARHALHEGPLAGRTPGAIEFKFANIAAALVAAGLPRLRGFTPRPNKQRTLTERVLAVARQHGLTPASDPTGDPVELRRRSRLLQEVAHLGKGSNNGPKLDPSVGADHPEAVNVKRMDYKRSPQVVAQVLAGAAGVCEVCAKPAPFETADGELYLEVHHVRLLSEGGPDRTTNAVAACPNCHQRLHHGADRLDAREDLYRRIGRLVRE